MKRSRLSEEHVIVILREAQAGSSVKTVCAAYNISEATYHAWKRKYGGMDVSEARRLRSLEEENGRLKRIIADLGVQNQVLQEVNAKREASIRREEGLKVSKKQRRTKRVGNSTAERLKAKRTKHVWSWDFEKKSSNMQKTPSVEGAFKVKQKVKFDNLILRFWG